MQEKFPENYPTTGAAIVLFILFILFCLWLGKDIKPDLSSDGGYIEQEQNCGPGGAAC